MIKTSIAHVRRKVGGQISEICGDRILRFIEENDDHSIRKGVEECEQSSRNLLCEKGRAQKCAPASPQPPMMLNSQWRFPVVSVKLRV